jgi:hypothetical protein
MKRRKPCSAWPGPFRSPALCCEPLLQKENPTRDRAGQGSQRVSPRDE